MNNKIPGIFAYSQAIQAMQQQVIESQADLLASVADAMVNTIMVNNRIFLFGTGHSGLVLEESFVRAGGLAAAVPMFSSSLMLHENTDLAMRLERTAKIAPSILVQYAPKPNEMIFIFSNSGVNQLPIEMALMAKKMNLIVVTICSFRYSKAANVSQIGRKLMETGDFNIDNGGVPGDALVPIKGYPWRVSPSSSIMNILIWNSLVSEVSFRLVEKGIDPPIFISGNYQNQIEGAEKHNQKVAALWGPKNPHYPYLYQNPTISKEK